jgi:hypothetical protein
MSYDKNTIVYKDNVFSLNELLLKKQNIGPAKLEEIKELHVQRLKIEESFTLGQISAEDYKEAWEMNQFYLQDAWGFPQNAKYHRFWEMKGCTCRGYENLGRYPKGPYIYSKDCAVHGKV